MLKRPAFLRSAESLLMFTSSLDTREVQLLIVALRYWRTHRIDGVTRRTDPPMTPDTIDSLLAKLAASANASLDRSGSDS